MSAQQRHDHRTVVGYGNHRRLARLVGQQRGHGANQDARRADADDGVTGGEQVARMVQRVGKCNRGIGAPLAAMQGAVECIGDPSGDGFTGGVQRQDDRCQSHGSAPFAIRIMEKYGASSGASASGSTRSAPSVARST